MLDFVIDRHISHIFTFSGIYFLNFVSAMSPKKPNTKKSNTKNFLIKTFNFAKKFTKLLKIHLKLNNRCLKHCI
ncbi:hypothetical protein BpHYR1_030475 [Brachionus plicatilis]|uniref:Uncharacterized protein n=1 Tax=Brachionus plicatilis TaxID=10195 RepID=A0A3M7Q5G6_BRAPC|nr:hypothetical protein BpHYR1_030475 [Brachionus plicatilis]